MTLIGISLSLGASRHSGDPVPTIQLSATSIAEDAASGSVVGALSVSNGSGSYTYSITSDPDSKFAIDGSNLETAATLDYETDTSHSVTIEADNGVDDPISRVFTITVTNVLEVTLSALTLSADEWTIGTPSDGTIDADTAGSSISVSGTLPTGLTIDTTARTWDWDGTGSVSTGSFDLVETHVDASNSPRTSTINWGIVEAPAFSTFNDMPAMNDALDTTGRAVLMVIGDSTKDGVGANGLGTMANAYNINATAALAAELALLGFNVSRDCYGFGDHGTNTSTVSALAGYYGNVTIPSSWSIGGIASPWGANACYKTADSEAITITPHLACDTVELFYLQYPGNGDLSVDRGGTAQTVSTSGTHQVGSQQFTFPLGTQDVNIKVASGFAGVFAIRMWNSTTERLVIVDGSCTNGGWTTANLLTNAAMGGSAAANIGRLRADGFIFNYGLNDKYNSRTSSAFQTDLETIINAGLAGDAPNTTLSPDVVIEIPNSCNSSSPADFDATWKACVTNAAINTSIRAPLDLYALFDPWASFSTKFYDDIHPDEEGYADIGAAEAAYL